MGSSCLTCINCLSTQAMVIQNHLRHSSVKISQGRQSLHQPTHLLSGAQSMSDGHPLSFIKLFQVNGCQAEMTSSFSMILVMSWQQIWFWMHHGSPLTHSITIGSMPTDNLARLPSCSWQLSTFCTNLWRMRSTGLSSSVWEAPSPCTQVGYQQPRSWLLKPCSST